VLHFTSPENIQKILAPDSKGLRASKVGQLGGGLSVVGENVDHFLLTMWNQHGASPWPEKVGRALWGEGSGKKVWLGNPDHKFIECVLVLSIPVEWVKETNEHCRVPGRPYVRILQNRSLIPGGDGCHYLHNDRIVKAYDLRPGADQMACQMIRKQLSVSGLRWSQVRAEASDLGVSEKELREFDNTDHPLVECMKRFRELQVELFEPRGASKLMCQNYDRLRALAKYSGARDSLVAMADDAGGLEDRKRILTLYLLVLSRPATPLTPSTSAPSSRASSVDSRDGGTSRFRAPIEHELAGGDSWPQRFRAPTEHDLAGGDCGPQLFRAPTEDELAGGDSGPQLFRAPTEDELAGGDGWPQRFRAPTEDELAGGDSGPQRFRAPTEHELAGGDCGPQRFRAPTEDELAGGESGPQRFRAPTEDELAGGNSGPQCFRAPTEHELAGGDGGPQQEPKSKADLLAGLEMVAAPPEKPKPSVREAFLAVQMQPAPSEPPKRPGAQPLSRMPTFFFEHELAGYSLEFQREYSARQLEFQREYSARGAKTAA